MANWYLADADFARVYDDFVVPPGGTSVVAVFSNNSFYGAPPVAKASWEIRSGVSAGVAGTLVASGVSSATQTYNPNTGDYRIQVDGLQVQLAQGRYWLSVTPVGPGTPGTAGAQLLPGTVPATIRERAARDHVELDWAGRSGGRALYDLHYRRVRPAA